MKLDFKSFQKRKKNQTLFISLNNFISKTPSFTLTYFVPCFTRDVLELKAFDRKIDKYYSA